MSRKTLIPALAFLCALACTKDNGPGAGKSNGKPRIYIDSVYMPGFYSANDSFTLRYDDSSRLSTMVSRRISYAYHYDANNNFTLDVYPGGVWSMRQLGFLNSRSLLDTALQYGATDSSSERYTYAGTQLTSHLLYNHNGHGPQLWLRFLYTSDSTGNITKEIETDSAHHILEINTFTYTDKPVQFDPSTLYEPPFSKYLFATKKSTNANGSSVLTFSYSYEFDGTGRLTKATTTQSDGQYEIKSYVY